MNQYSNPFTASNPFGFTNAFATPTAFGSCGTGCFPGVNNTFGGPTPGGFGPMFQNPWGPGLGNWINTGGTPNFGYASTPTGWTNSTPNRWNGTGAFPANTNSFGFNPFGGSFGGWNNWNNWNTPFGWTNANPFTGGNPNFNTPSFGNTPSFPGYNSFAGWTNGFSPATTNFYGSFPWNGQFQTPFGATPWTNSTPWNWNTGNMPWNWNTNTFFTANPGWNTTPNFMNTFGANPGFFWANAFANTPSFNPAFFSGVNPGAFTTTNTPYYAPSNGQNVGGGSYPTGITNQPNTNPGLCRDAA